MEFSNNMSPTEIYGSKENVQLVDVLINRNGGCFIANSLCVCVRLRYDAILVNKSVLLA